MGLFDDTTGELRATLDPAASAGGVTVWDPTGHRIDSSTTDGWVTIWDVSDLNHPRPTARLKRGRSGNICGCPLIPVVFSPDGRQLVSLEVAGITVFDVATGQVAGVFSLGPAVLDQAAVAAAFSPNERSVVLAFGPSPSRRSILMLVDPATGKVRASAELPYPPEGVAFLAGGARIATVQRPPDAPLSSFTALDLWNGRTLQHLGDSITAPGYLPNGAQPSLDGTALVSGSFGGGAALVWDLAPDRWEASACRIAGRNLTKAEWGQYLTGTAPHSLCPQWATSR
jgi:WD40 repeat protein